MIFRHVTLDKIIRIKVSEESVASIFSFYTKRGEGEVSPKC